VIWTRWIKNEWDALPVLFRLAKILAIFVSKIALLVRKWKHGIFFGIINLLLKFLFITVMLLSFLPYILP